MPHCGLKRRALQGQGLLGIVSVTERGRSELGSTFPSHLSVALDLPAWLLTHSKSPVQIQSLPFPGPHFLILQWENPLFVAGKM